MIEKFKESLDKGHQFGALLTNLSKAFDCIDHKPLNGTRMEFRFHQLIYFLLTLAIEHSESKSMIVSI